MKPRFYCRSCDTPLERVEFQFELNGQEQILNIKPEDMTKLVHYFVANRQETSNPYVKLIRKLLWGK